MHDALTTQVLSWVNETRKSKYPRMPKLKTLLPGDKDDCANCPVANSLRHKTDDNVRVYCGEWEWNESYLCLTSKLPAYVIDWVKAFDSDSECYEDFEAVFKPGESE